MLYYLASWPILIVCPSSPKLTWRAELQKWFLPALLSPAPCPHLVMRYLGLSSIVRVLEESKEVELLSSPPVMPPIIVVSYGLVSRPAVAEWVNAKLRPKMVIVDESHYIKHETSTRTKVVTKIAHQPYCKQALLMSGTPMERCQDLYSQLHCLYPRYFPRFFYKSYQQYRQEAGKKFYFAEYFCGGTYKKQVSSFASLNN